MKETKISILARLSATETKLKQEIEKNDRILHELNSRREQITDINQWAYLLNSNRDLMPRVRQAMIADIWNRTTD
jgi:hypothetical protein